MNSIKTLYKLMEVSSRDLEIPDAYQRKLNTERVAKIVAGFNERIANEPKVSFRDGHYYVFDGQHTIVARKHMNGNNDLPILCKVYYGMTEARQDEKASSEGRGKEHVFRASGLRRLREQPSFSFQSGKPGDQVFQLLQLQGKSRHLRFHALCQSGLSGAGRSRRNPSSDEVCRPLRGRFSQRSDRSLPAGGGNGAQTEGEGAEITPCPRR